MGQIVKRKKKGRPSKADLAARAISASERDVRRSLRRRNVKHNVIDYDDDFIEDDEGEEEEEEMTRREKKVKLVVKLHSNENARGRHLKGNGAEEEDEDDDDEEEVRGEKPLKKRKIDSVDDAGYDSDNMDDNNDNRNDHVDDHDDEVCIVLNRLYCTDLCET